MAASIVSSTVTRYGMLLATVWMAAVVLLQFEPLNDVDIYWQVRLGQLMLNQGHLVTADSFTFTHAGSVVPCVGWLAQIIFASLYNLGSWRAVQIAKRLAQEAKERLLVELQLSNEQLKSWLASFIDRSLGMLEAIGLGVGKAIGLPI